MSASFELACRKLATALGEDYDDVRAATIRGYQQAESSSKYEGVSAGMIAREAYSIFIGTLRERKTARQKGLIIEHFYGIEGFSDLLPKQES